MKHKFTLRNIKNYLKEYLDIEWVDNIVYCTQDDKYRKAKLSDFGKMPVQLLLKLSKNQNKFLMLVEVTDNTFIIEHVGNKINASAGWNDYMYNCQILTSALEC